MEKTFDAQSAEARIYETWEKAGAFKAGANASRAETFCVMIPPPNVTGSLHMGHAFNNTLQDILVRWHRMRGFDTLWQPGQDHAGIATQMVVERELARSQQPGRREMGREAFLEKVWEWKEQSGGTIINQLKRLGASCDWSRNAFTMDPTFQQAVIKVFVDMYDKGYIYRGKRLVNWDPHFETAISDLEVENVEVKGHMWHFKYPLENGETYEYVEKDADGNVTLREVRDYISIATTRPETMLGDGAVAVHPSDERYAPIVGKRVLLPLADRYIPIIADEYPDPTFGSGAVKITGAHDFNDYKVAERHGLPLYVLLDGKGRMRDDAADDNMVPEKYRGLDRFEARKLVIADIEALGLLEKIEDKIITQPFGDRSKVVIEPMLTDQWFVDTTKIVGPALDAVRNGDTRILPERDEKVYFHWLENIEPWTISRQLWWGHQIPVWYGLDLGVPQGSDLGDEDRDGEIDEVEIFDLLMNGGMLHRGEVHYAATDFDAVRERFLDEIADIPAPFSHSMVVEVTDKAEAIERLAASLAAYNIDQDPTKLVYPVWRDADVLDTWFSSGLWPIGTLGWPEDTPELRKYFPTDVLVTGFDIIFFWVARMMMMQLAVVGQVPFHTVYVHALVRDEKGKKMSKSLGNVLDPLELIDEYGADAVRFTLTAMAAMGRDLKLSTQRIAGYRNFGTKLWNAARFAEMNGVWENHATGSAPLATATANRWILGETGRIRETVDEALAAYRFNDAANALYAFVWGRVCDWYVEFAKPLLADEATAAETRAVMAWVLDQCFVLLHPMMPFVTEELWETTGKRAKMLVHTDWPTYGAELGDAEADREMGWVISLIEEIRSARAQMHVPVALKLAIVVTSIDEAGRAAWARNEALIRRLARIETLTEADTAPRGSVTIAVEGATFALPLDGVIDIGEEKVRLEKTLQKLDKDLSGLRSRLANPKFAESAPEDVVEETREKLELGEEEAAKLRSALTRLAEIA
ncbi:valine--tRNA ligase [Haematobacter massiliensis]|uniref:Valine--tRNA ligase n=3 Tax=Haematobacter massiliensis TaxID=195105 RepID=A0A086YCQ3_9RHOB|nr:valine--tRNA ligase [Haematobacter massiliensis]KFI32053.1 valine--tRNA ligase [Haematobacter massiliensis]OWJ72656.1 valine--tRNA ligase [Haematobacter massiliensis]OWJ86795.1 valine--tRNA ligase [Haematobacter massiliensis]